MLCHPTPVLLRCYLVITYNYTGEHQITLDKEKIVLGIHNKWTSNVSFLH